MDEKQPNLATMLAGLAVLAERGVSENLGLGLRIPSRALGRLMLQSLVEVVAKVLPRLLPCDMCASRWELRFKMADPSLCVD